MDLGQTGAALEHEWHLGFGKEFENHAAEVIFLDETREESSFLGGKLDGGAQIFGEPPRASEWTRSRVAVPNHAPTRVDGAALRSSRNPWNRTSGRGEASFQLPNETLRDSFTLQQRADAADRPLVPVSQRQIDELVGADPLARELASDPAVCARKTVEPRPVIDGVDQ